MWHVCALFIEVIEETPVMEVTGSNHKDNLFFLALAVSAIWALHPLQVSTVMYAVQRMTILMATFTLLAIIFYVRARIASESNQAKSLLYLVITAIFTILACFSKENGALIVLYVGLLEIQFRFFSPSSLANNSVVRFSNFIIFLVTITLAIGITVFAMRLDSVMSGYQIRDFTVFERLGTQSNIVIMYLKNIFLPNISNMNLYFDDFPVSGIASSESLKSYAIIFLLIIAALFTLKNIPLFSFGILFFFFSHSLESTFIPLELAFEHRNYSGTIGISIATVALLVHICSRFNIEKIIPIVVGTALILITFQTHSRSLEWSDDLVLNTLAVENNPRSERAKLSLAISHLNRSDLTSAVNLFERAAKENKKDAHTHLHLMQFKAYGGVFDPEDYIAVLDLLNKRPITNDVVMILDDMLTNVTNGIYAKPGLERVSKLLRTATENQNLMIFENNRAALFARYSKSLSLLGRHRDALAALRISTELNPRNPEIIIMMAEEYAALNQADEIPGVLAKISPHILITKDQLKRISELTKLANNNQFEPIEITHSPD